MHLLVIRNSAMGDVALMAPALKALRKQYPELRITLLTRPAYHTFFTSIEGIELFQADYEKRHKSLKGIFFLFRDLKKHGAVDYVVDLHGVLRSRILGFLFRLTGVPSAVIDKGREEKKKVINGSEKTRLKHTVERYQEVFARAGFKISFAEGPWIIPSPDAVRSAVGIIGMNDGINIGVAPYAKHLLKMWPEDYMVSLLRMISEKYDARFWLFGGKDENKRLQELSSKVPGSVNLSGRLKLGEEIAIISKMDLMISMDSSNMHIAALTGIKVISVWGATDPMTGFSAWGQPEDFSVYIPESQLTCRPCTVYGKGRCRRKDHACMMWLKPEMVLKRIEFLRIF